ncbi:MAG: patatin-like phospholipase family protein [Nitrospira sp.]|nr:patatin-like phospholipase family protein [Nitrospira sp.]
MKTILARTLSHSIRLMVLLVFTAGGCASARPPVPTHFEVVGASNPTRASHELGEKERRDGRFIGLAISGGGSRAAVFGAAVMKELERLGILQQIDVLSAVSGGALPAAYYALDGYKDIDFSNGVLQRMGQDFQGEVLGRWLSPPNLFRYWFTETTKADTVVSVLDEELFHGATYADLNPDRPTLLLNSTNALTGEPFVISDESFAGLEPSLASFSVARAVYMSAAYPGLFDAVALRGKSGAAGASAGPAVLAYDGGPVDNLGVKTLVTMLNRAVERESLGTQFSEGCLLISVDATPRLRQHDGKPLPAATVLLKSNRREVLERAGIPADRQDRARFGRFAVGTDNRQGSCSSWHLALRQLPDDDPLGAKVTRIETSLKIDVEDQQALIAAAKRLVEESLEVARLEGRTSFLPPSPSGH